MIRRSASKPGRERWVLISQVEHARLSGELAGAWGAPPYAALSAEIIAAIAHHDDGWSAWEVAPKVDDKTGCPLDFTETPLTDSLGIWRSSIEAAAHFGPLPGHMVSGHFSALLERFSSRWQSDRTLTTLAKTFLDEQSAERARFLSKWSKSADGGGTAAEADRAVAWLQMFDWMSLWLCCAERSEPERFSPPAGPTLTMRPGTNPYDIEVSPWPFRERTLEIEAVGRSIPALRYANASDVVTAPAEPIVLKWLLRPAAG